MSDNDTLDWEEWGEQLNQAEKGKALKRKSDEMTASSMAGYAERVLNNPDIKATQKKRKKKVSHETPIQVAIMKALAKVDGVTKLKRTNAGSAPISNGDGTYRYAFMGTPGQADIHFTYNGIPCAFEVKIIKPYKTYASKSQKKYLSKFTLTGIAAVVRSVADALRVLEVGQVGEVVKW